MSYSPAPPPATYDAQWVRQELSKIREAIFSPVPFERLEPQHQAPNKPREGMIVFADGTDWDPGSGAGYYGYFGGSWVFLGALEHGQCRFVRVSADECRLMPYNGNGLIINGKQYRIPRDGVPFSVSSVASGATAYVAAVDDGSGGIALALYPLSAGHAAHTDGVEIVDGNPGATLVGLVNRDAANGFWWDATHRYVASWFNRREVGLVLNSDMTSSSTSWANASGVMYCALWANSRVLIGANGQALRASSGNTEVFHGILANGSAVAYVGAGATLNDTIDRRPFSAGTTLGVSSDAVQSISIGAFVTTPVSVRHLSYLYAQAFI